MKIPYGLLAVIFIACLALALVKSCGDVEITKRDNDVLRSDNTLQGQVIATQAFNFSRFNQVTEYANRLNSLTDIGTEDTVIEYREILRREKTCDMPVPADIAGGLLEYAHRLRASAMYADPGRPDSADVSAATTSLLTYCEAVLWIKPLLAVIEKGNNNFWGIRQIESGRQ